MDAALEIPSTYCAFVYAQRLTSELGSKDQVLSIAKDFRTAGLSQRDVKMLAFAQKVARSAHEITEADVDTLREHGFTDPQVADIALCASLCCFMSRYFEATGTGPEPRFIDTDETFREATMVGRKV